MSGLDAIEQANSSPFEGGCFAKWRDRTWKVTAKQINTLSDATWSDEWDTDDKQREASEAEFVYPLYLELMPDVDIAAEIRSWRALIGKAGYLYLGGTLFGTQKKYWLTGVDVSDIGLVRGEIVRCEITLRFTEDKDSAPEKLPKRKQKSTTAYPTSDDQANGVSVHRLRNPIGGNHMLTATESERDALQRSGWIYEGIAFSARRGGTEAVYRLYSPANGDHVWTTSTAERSALKTAGWTYEGVAWYADDSGEAVYRLFNPNSGFHLWTFSQAERSALEDAGWVYEGVGFWI